jgi:hypothetical protein
MLPKSHRVDDVSTLRAPDEGDPDWANPSKCVDDHETMFHGEYVMDERQFGDMCETVWGCLENGGIPLLVGRGRLRVARAMHHRLVTGSFSGFGEPANVCADECPAFRCPHHTVSAAGMVGGIRQNPETGEVIARGGEMTLAHDGVLFLDEAAEFSCRVLEAVRWTRREGNVEFTEHRTAVTMSADFHLILGTLPCPCGHYGDAEQACICSGSAMERYRERITKFFPHAEVFEI